MAKLITTPEEEAAASFLDWPDAALGAMCKKMALTLKRQRDADRLRGATDDDIGAVINAADGMLIVGSAIECNAGTITVTFGDFTHKGVPGGDWEFRVRQLPKRKSKARES